MTPVVQSVELPGRVTLQYVEQGNPDGIPLVFLHGIADSWRSFELVLPHVPQTIHAFALTQRGHGDSSRPASGYRPRDFADDVVAFMDALGIDAAVVAGHSMGSYVGQRFAIDYPDRALALVLISARAALSNRPGVLDWWDSTVSKLTDPVDPEFVRRFTVLAQPVPPWFSDSMLQENLKVPARVWREAIRGGLDDDPSGELQRVTSPTLIVWGGRDATVRREDTDRLVASIPNARLIVYPAAGHALHWEEPERFARDLSDFVLAVGASRDPSG